MKKYPFYTIIFFSFSLLLIFVLILPTYQDLTSLRKKISEKEAELEIQEKYFQELQKISEELKNYEIPLSKIDSALPLKPSLPELLNFIQKASSQSGLSLKEIGQASTFSVEKEKIKETKLDLVLVGSYSDFKNFLSVLEKSARIIEVENISFSTPKEGSFNFILTIKVYSY